MAIPLLSRIIKPFLRSQSVAGFEIYLLCENIMLPAAEKTLKEGLESFLDEYLTDFLSEYSKIEGI